MTQLEYLCGIPKWRRKVALGIYESIRERGLPEDYAPERVIWNIEAELIRRLPEKFATPGWTPPVPPLGRKWHRDFTEDELPDGTRPLLDGENITPGDYRQWEAPHWFVVESKNQGAGPASDKTIKFRTYRPLPTAENPLGQL